ncbi:acylphosphatase [Noviherbaspirillum sedimenti]|uniref:acylphosphatase n=2 Tax=Noviherbaspirillum sedimenti TaxID=2320865 RepID=A0A3A3G1K1_9BURK|nr:acylphosphatase [Noviherbaspirillum sedimenti]
MARHLRISGIVQGVGYRAAFEREARALGLSGWVRNRLDGSVEALVAGDADALAGIIAWAWRGPAAAQVEQVAVADADGAQMAPGRFERRPTA